MEVILFDLILNQMIDLILVKDITGYISTVLLIILYLPQVFVVFRNRDAHGLTLPYLICSFLISSDSVVYGVLLNELPIIIANVVAALCVLALLLAKWLFRENVKSPPHDPPKENV
jgi:uncharacterized protein with PQ loop repeat